MSRILLLAISLFVIPIATLATGQIGDILIMNGDTLSLFSNPLESHPDIKSFRSKLFNEVDPPWNTGCGRAYRAEWSLEGDTLYLLNIYSCDYPNDSVKTDLKLLFKEYYVAGKVAATWVNDELYVPLGKCLIYIHSGYESIYEREIGLEIKDGILSNKNEYDNTGTHISKYYQNPNLLEEDLTKRINWKDIPDLGDKEITVYLSAYSGRDRRPQNIKLLRASESEKLNSEAIKAIEKINDWDVFYKHGQINKMAYGIPIKFSEKNRLKAIKKEIK